MVASLRSLLRDVTVATLAAGGVTTPARAASGALTIVTFHRVLPEALRQRYPLPNLAVTPEELDFLLGQFARHFRCQRLDDGFRAWRQGGGDPRPRLCVTFDDGQLDNHRHALPVLSRHRVPATFFIPVHHVQTGEPLWHDRLGFAVLHAAAQGEALRRRVLERVGLPVHPDETDRQLLRRVLDEAKRMPDGARLEWVAAIEDLVGAPPIDEEFGMMGWDHVRALVAAGHEVGSHALTHPILPNCDDDKIAVEVTESTRVLTRELGTPIRTFCYPNGDYDQRVISAVRDDGYLCAVTTQHGLNREGASRFTLRRADMHPDRLRDRRGRLSSSRLMWRLSALGVRDPA